MKKWKERTLFILGLGIVGILSLAVRPAFHADRGNDIAAPANKVHDLQEKFDKNLAFSCDYVWDFSHHPTHTVLMGDLEPDAFSLLEDAQWRIHLETKDGELHVSYDQPVLHAKNRMSQVRADYLSYFVFPHLYRLMPDGQIHVEYNIFLLCEVTITPSFWGKPIHTFAIQNLMVDIMDASVDVTAPKIPARFGKDLPYKKLEQGAVAKLPSRYCGSPAEQGMTQVLYMLSDIRVPFSAGFQAEKVRALAEKTVSLYADASKPWPDCWGDDADVARRLSQRVVPTLLRLQEKDCYKSQPLADFINSPVFARIFGESFPDSPTPKVQEEPIEFRAVTPEEMESGEKDSEKN